jgi:hypothetical protein
LLLLLLSVSLNDKRSSVKIAAEVITVDFFCQRC